MGIRDRLNQRSGLTVSVIVALIGVAVALTVWQVLRSRPAFRTELPESYYTTDDGQTYFAASSENVAPFDHEGQQAVQAYVYECDGKRFVGFLERYTPEARQAMIEKKATPQHQIYGRELKKPGEGTWAKSGDLDAVARVTDVKCPHGSSHAPEPVEP